MRAYNADKGRGVAAVADRKDYEMVSISLDLNLAKSDLSLP